MKKLNYTHVFAWYCLRPEDAHRPSALHAHPCAGDVPGAGAGASTWAVHWARSADSRVKDCMLGLDYAI